MKRTASLPGIFLAALFALSSALPAQQTNPTQVYAQIVTSGRGEVTLVPDRARIDLSVETRGPSAAAAAAENARVAQNVHAALRRLGLSEAQLGTHGYSVNPEYDYSRSDGRPRVIGYVARNTVRAELRDVAQAATTIDASLSAGANSIGGLYFYSSNVEAARKEALTKAVEQARQDAEVMARAAGGTLGDLIELSSSSMDTPSPMPYMARASMEMAQAAPTPVNPGEQTLVVTVSARWRFVQ